MPIFAKRMLLSILCMIAALATTGCISVSNETTTAAQVQPAGPFMVTHSSNHDFATTLGRLKAGIDERGLTTFAVIDHSAGAQSIGADLRSTTLVIFGNPKGGTPLLQAAQTIGFDLPLKALVFEGEGGEVSVAVTDVNRVFGAHSDAAPPPQVEAIGMMLDGLAREAGE